MKTVLLASIYLRCHVYTGTSNDNNRNHDAIF